MRKSMRLMVTTYFLTHFFSLFEQWAYQWLWWWRWQHWWWRWWSGFSQQWEQLVSSTKLSPSLWRWWALKRSVWIIMGRWWWWWWWGWWSYVKSWLYYNPEDHMIQGSTFCRASSQPGNLEWGIRGREGSLSLHFLPSGLPGCTNMCYPDMI